MYFLKNIISFEKSTTLKYLGTLKCKELKQYLGYVLFRYDIWYVDIFLPWLFLN